MGKFPRSFGRYVVEEKIAVGGMAEVYKASLSGIDGFRKNFAIKRLLSSWTSDPEFCRMLIEEAKLVSHLVHPNIVQVFELARDHDELFLVLEYVNGLDLSSLLEDRPLPLEAALQIAHQGLLALSYAHSVRDEQGNPLHIIHRDVSPQNILVSYEGAVKLTDFGIARAALRQRRTASGVLKGKFAYMSPEQSSGLELDVRSDLFSLGIVLYEMLTGHRLFEGRGDLETLEKVRRCEVDFLPLRSFPPGMVPMVQKALAKEKEGRFPSAAEFLREIKSYASQHQLRLEPEPLIELLDSRGGRKFSHETDRTLAAAPTPMPLAAILILPLLFVLPSDRKPVAPLSPPEGTGFLNLQAVPWGQWVIDGDIRMESPVRRYSLPAGGHRVQAFYGPGNRHFAQDVRLESGDEVTCVANFLGEGEGMKCD